MPLLLTSLLVDLLFPAVHLSIEMRETGVEVPEKGVRTPIKNLSAALTGRLVDILKPRLGTLISYMTTIVGSRVYRMWSHYWWSMPISRPSSPSHCCC